MENLVFKGGYRHGCCNCLFLCALLPGFIAGIYCGISVRAVYGLEWCSTPQLNSSKLFCMIYLALPFLICPLNFFSKALCAFFRAFILVRAATCGYVFYVLLNCSGLKTALSGILFDLILSFALCEFTDSFSALRCDSSQSPYLTAVFSVIAFALASAFILY